jgi:hypothetical protein
VLVTGNITVCLILRYVVVRGFRNTGGPVQVTKFTSGDMFGYP